MKNIVVINQSPGYLMRDLTNAMLEEYEEVVLLAGRKQISNNTINICSNVKLDSIIDYDKSSTLKRLYTWLIGTLQILFKLWTRYRGYKLFIISNPPFAPILPLFTKNKYSILIWDIFPDVLVTQGLMTESNPFIKGWKKINCKVYSKANCFYTIGDGLANCLSQYVQKERIKIVPLWPDKSNLRYINKDQNEFIKQNHLENKFIVLYSGNMGNTHRMDVLIDVAKEMKDEKDLMFVLIGEGGRKPLIQKKMDEYNLDNVLLLPYQPYEFLSHSLSSANIAVVTLDTTASELSVPSKTFNLLSLGRPLMCIASEESELSKMNDQHHFGALFMPENVCGMKDFIHELKNNSSLYEEYHKNALEASTYYTVDNAKLFVD